MRERFQVRVDRLWWPLLLLGGATRDRSHLEIDDDELLVRLGLMFSHRFSLANIEGAGLVRPRWWVGMGWRTNLLGTISLVGSTSGIVEIRLRQAVLVWLPPLPQRCSRLVASLDEPEMFIQTLTKVINEA